MLRATLKELGESPEAGARTSPNSVADESSAGSGKRPLPTIMCIEGRPRQQDILREYLSKRGFRVLVLSDVQRGLDRLKSNPPDGIVLMGGSIGDQVADAYYQAERWGRRGGMVCIAVLSEKQADLKTQLHQSSRSRVLVEPIPLRDLRREIHLAFHSKAGDEE
jgi:DNA-binding response OmpR family regulator